MTLHGRGVFHAIVGDSILDATFVGGDCMKLNANDAKKFRVIRKELLEIASGELVHILILNCNSWASIKDNVFIPLVNWSLSYSVVPVLSMFLL